MTVLIAGVCLFFCACKKDKYTTAPQIEYKSLSSNVYDNSLGSQPPKINFRITDAEGDLGDTAYVFIKNLLTNDSIQLSFPDLNASRKNDFKADVSTSVGRLQGPSCGTTARIDTMYYEFYVEDFAKNKSNVVRTTDPVFQFCN